LIVLLTKRRVNVLKERFVLSAWQVVASLINGYPNLAFLKAQVDWLYTDAGFSTFRRDYEPALQREATLVKRDIPEKHRTDFDSFMAGICAWQHGKTKDENQKRIFDSINGLFLFVESLCR